MDIHAPIQRFLQQQTVTDLQRIPRPVAPEGVTKAGVVPFLRGADYRYYLMKPIARHHDLGAPRFQLCKGTRMQQTPSGWQDMRDGQDIIGPMEPLAVTALRESIEELGMKLENIVRLHELGSYAFASAKTGKKKDMWLFAAEMASPEGFLPDADVATTTEARGWMNLAEFKVAGREDHLYILQDIAARLREYYRE